MLSVSIPRRYARALLAATAESSAFDKVLEQLEGLVQIFQSNPELSDVVLNPGYTRSERAAVVEALVRLAEPVEPLVANLMRLLVERQRLPYLPDIARLFRDLGDAAAGRIRAQVTSAVPLADPALRELESNLGRLTQRRVLLQSRVDPSILGGAAAQVGSTLYDGSLRSQLEQLRQSLKRT
jgi:F-type H+-transporting ATPase subunit delta